MVIPNPNLGLRIGIPSVTEIGDALAIIRTGALRDLSPDLSSVRAFARAIGVSESTLRTAYLTEGRRPSDDTQRRIDNAIRQNIGNILGRTVRDASIVDRGYGRNPLARLYLQTPPGVRRVRIVVRLDPTQDIGFGGKSYESGFYTVTLDARLRAFRVWEQLKPPTHTVEAVIWQYETREVEVPLESVD
jgi:hypothetical protein